MKRLFTTITCLAFFLLLTNSSLQAQSFTVQHDTVTYNYISGIVNVEDGVDNTSTNPTDSVTLQWSVIATNFPVDWIQSSGVCDNNVCYTLAGLWPSGAVRQSFPYPNGLGDFHLQLSLSTATTTGSYYLTVRMNNKNIPTDTATETYIISNYPEGVATVNNNNAVSLFPNPAHNTINISYSAAAGIKTIEVYDVTGRVVMNNQVNSNTNTSLNIEGLVKGTYFARLVNGNGKTTEVKKFIKQ